jgi:hypothetical protein
MCPVRELTPGDRPRDWVKSTNESAHDPPNGEDSNELPPEIAALARVNTAAPDLLAPEHFKVQFTATAEYVGLVDEAKALLSHAHPHATLEEIHLRAMRALVSELSKKKYAVPHHPRQRGRHIPAAVRRAVFERDGNQCTFGAAAGKRCAETHRLEFHHLTPFADGGEHDASNLTLRCAAHNALAAEEDFGRELVERKKRSRSHEPFCNQAP